MGQEAADELMLKIREFIATWDNVTSDVTVMVKACANLTGLAQTCVRNGKSDKVGDLSSFVAGFSRRHALCDFVDIGPGKEEADNKIRSM